MLKMAQELARHGHGLPMIEALLKANGFHEADVFLNQPHIHKELVEVADRARRGCKPPKEPRAQPFPSIPPSVVTPIRQMTRDHVR